MINPIRRSPIRPLSSLQYFRNNSKRSLSLVVALALSIFLIITFQMVSYHLREDSRIVNPEKYGYFTEVYPGDQGSIASGVLKRIVQNHALERKVSFYTQSTNYDSFGSANITVYFMKDADLQYVFGKLGLKLTEGRMPIPGKQEILLDWRLAKNKGKKSGDWVGKELNPREKLPGKYKIVGVFTGSCLIGLGPIAPQQAKATNSLLLFPKAGQLEIMNTGFTNTPFEQARFWMKRYAEDNYRENTETNNQIFSVMYLAIIFVLSFASGNSNYALYFSRRYEFGILHSIGYSKGQILLRAATEIGLLNFVGFISGMLLGLGTGVVLGQMYFEPRGLPFMLIRPDQLISAMTIPACTALFGLIPAGWLLARIDPLTVIEKFE